MQRLRLLTLVFLFAIGFLGFITLRVAISGRADQIALCYFLIGWIPIAIIWKFIERT